MTRLRQQTLEELERRNYSANTIRVYLRAVEDFACYFKRRPRSIRTRAYSRVSSSPVTRS